MEKTPHLQDKLFEGNYLYFSQTKQKTWHTMNGMKMWARKPVNDSWHEWTGWGQVEWGENEGRRVDS